MGKNYDYAQLILEREAGIPSDIPRFEVNPERRSITFLIVSTTALAIAGIIVLGISRTDGWRSLGESLLMGGLLGLVLLLAQKQLDRAAEIVMRRDQVTFAGSDLVGANFAHWGMLHNPYFAGRDLRYAIFDAMVVGGDPMLHPDISGAVFDHANLSHGRFIGTRFPATARFVQAQCIGIIMIESEVSEANFNGANCTGGLFHYAHLASANFTYARLNSARFLKAILTGADFSNAVLFEASLVAADLRDANFGGADLRGADFRGADVTGATFDGAQVEGTLWDGAIGCDLANVHLVSSMSNTGIYANEGSSDADLESQNGAASAALSERQNLGSVDIQSNLVQDDTAGEVRYPDSMNSRQSGLDSHVALHTSGEVSRNAPCPCGSGKKFKQCHGDRSQ